MLIDYVGYVNRLKLIKKRTLQVKKNNIINDKNKLQIMLGIKCSAKKDDIGKYKSTMLHSFITRQLERLVVHYSITKPFFCLFLYF